MLMWNDFVEMLGCQKMDERFIHLSQKFNELPKLDESVLGDTEYYSFIGSGILFLLDNGIVDQISFYIEADEVFSKFKGDLPLSFGCSESEVIHHFGVPSSSGGGGRCTSWLYESLDKI